LASRIRIPGTQAEDTRARILREASRVFAAKGYAGATTVDIAKRAKVTQPLVHHYFGSKERLWRAVLSDLYGRLSTELLAERARTEGEAAAERVRRMLIAFVQFSGRTPELSRVTRGESVSGGMGFETLYRDYLAPLVKVFEGVVQEAIRDGAFAKTEIPFAYFFVVGAATQLFAEPETAKRAFGLDARDPKLVDRYAEYVVNLVMRALSAKPTIKDEARAPRVPTDRKADASRPRAGARPRR
jgi:TetR/AcrR family transcriptional regulator